MNFGLNVKKKSNPPPAPVPTTDAPVDDIYDYDGIYDSMKRGERAAAVAKEIDKKERKPKYMENLLHMAEVRKRDRLQAQDVKVAREREAEGDMYADKEEFVTSAYKQSRLELQRLEEAERQREELLRKQGTGITSFRKTLLENTERKHEAAIAASLTANRNDKISDDISTTVSEAQLAKEAEEKLGRRVVLNDDNRIVDKRQLLSAGLNLPAPSSKHLSTSNRHVSSDSRQDWGKDRKEKMEQRQRQAEQVRQQLQESQKRQREEEIRKEEELRLKSRKTKTEDQVSSARERYLNRKKVEQEEREKEEKGD